MNALELNRATHRSVQAAARPRSMASGMGIGRRPLRLSDSSPSRLKNHWNVDRDPADHVRRSIYVFARRNLRYPIFEAFDRPDPNASCPRRNRSTTAPQSLMLLNGELTASLAQVTAGRLLLKQKTADARLTMSR